MSWIVRPDVPHPLLVDPFGPAGLDNVPKRAASENPPVRAGGRKLPVDFLGQTDRLGILVDEGNPTPIGQSIVAFGQRKR